MAYGIEEFHKEDVGKAELLLDPVPVTDGQTEEVPLEAAVKTEQLLLREGDVFSMDVLVPDSLPAPVEEGEMVGTVIYYMNGEIFDLFPVCTAEEVPGIDLEWCIRQIVRKWLFTVR